MDGPERVRAVVSELMARFANARSQHCRIEVEAADEQHLRLSGTVLDARTRDEVLAGLAEQLPRAVVDTAGLRVLRSDSPRVLTVATNLTGLYGKPSFMAEMQTQVKLGRELEVLLEEDEWVYVRQTDGYLGWVYGSYLTSSPGPEATYSLSAPITLLQREPREASATVMRLAGGTAVFVAETTEEWARLELAGELEGWVPLADLRAGPSRSAERAGIRAQMIEDASRLVGVPYLWGGTSAMGIDCSGLAQLLHALAGREIPRDADMQFAAGRPTEPPFEPGDLLYFKEEGAKRRVTHVGTSLGGWRMMHASVARNGVYEDDVQEVERLREEFVAARAFL